MTLLVAVDENDSMRVIHHGERVMNYGWSAPGQQLGYSTARSNGSAFLLIYDTATGQSRRITRHEDGQENYFSWTGSNSFLFAYRAPKAAAAELFMGRMPGSRRGQEADVSNSEFGIAEPPPDLGGYHQPPHPGPLPRWGRGRRGGRSRANRLRPAAWEGQVGTKAFFDYHGAWHTNLPRRKAHGAVWNRFEFDSHIGTAKRMNE